MEKVRKPGKLTKKAKEPRALTHTQSKKLTGIDTKNRKQENHWYKESTKITGTDTLRNEESHWK